MKQLKLFIFISMFAQLALANTFNCISMQNSVPSEKTAGIAQIKGIFTGRNLLEASNIVLTEFRIPRLNPVTGAQVQMIAKQGRFGRVELHTKGLPALQRRGNDASYINEITMDIESFSSPASSISSYTLWYHGYGDNNGYAFSDGQLPMSCTILPY
ncbi:MAG: hypothetical protein EOP06_07560 [Proteobacteria bacterium]|nr:MAG: hypothetical protein EOP06_07560 [Pseudomonadota bacterium]